MSRRTQTIVGYAAIICAALIFILVINFKYAQDYEIAVNNYRAQAHLATLASATRVEGYFANLQQSLNAIGDQPAIKNIDRYASNLDSTTRENVQLILKGLFDSNRVSEIYIVPSVFHPEEIDPTTNKPQEPIVKFKSAASEIKTENDSNQVTTIDEFRIMQKQMDYFAKNAKKFHDLATRPLIAGSEVQTSDDTQYAKTLNDIDRQGLVFTVPYYGTDGEFKGGISAIVRSAVLQTLLPKINFSLINQEYQFIETTQNMGQEHQSTTSIANAQADPDLLYSEVIPLKISDPKGKWVLWSGLPDTDFWNSPDAKQIGKARNFGYGVVLLFTAIFSLLWRTVVKSINNILEEKLLIEAEIESKVQAISILKYQLNESYAIFNSIGHVIITFDQDRKILNINNSAELLFGYSEKLLIGKSINELVPKYHFSDEILESLHATGEIPTILDFETLGLSQSHNSFPLSAQLSKAIHDNVCTYILSVKDISKRKKYEKKLKAENIRLIDAAHNAGRAVVATGMIHNVASILQAINNSSQLLTDRINKSELKSMVNICDLLNKTPEELSAFILNDPKGQLLPNYFAKLSKVWEHDKRDFIKELHAITTKVKSIDDLLINQKASNGVGHLVEELSLVKIIEDAITISLLESEMKKIEIIRDFHDLKNILLEKATVMLILINLMQNAKAAVLANGVKEKTVSLSLKVENDFAQIEVSDNGTGISQEDLNKLFTFESSVRKKTIGFGLYAGSIAAKEMGGALIAKSAGRNKGATFILQLPFKQSVDSKSDPAGR